jgi:rhodanese-related sulfurtransferase
MNNIITVLALLLIIYTLYPKIAIKFNKNVKNITGEEAAKLIKDTRDIVILDVRSKAEYKSGHISGSTLMPVQEISSRINDLEKYRGRPLLVHCASGGRSPKAVNILLKNKFTNIHHMNNGLSGFSGKIKR